MEIEANSVGSKNFSGLDIYLHRENNILEFDEIIKLLFFRSKEIINPKFVGNKKRI